jgi:hypothetical protein
MTEEYTVVQLNRQEELTRRIQNKLIDAAKRMNEPGVTVIAPAQELSDMGQNLLALSLIQSDECDGAIHEQRRGPVPTFIVDSENRIRVIKSTEGVKRGGEAFTSKEELATIGEKWSGSRLVKIWNGIAGVKPVRRFQDRQAAIDRIWKAIPATPNADLSPLSSRGIGTARQTRKVRMPRMAVLEIGKLREGSKKAAIVHLLQRRDGVSLKDLMAATGWQAHSVRGFLSAAVGKGMGIQVVSSKQENGQRVYQIR